jgi:hypothetical protein
LINLIARNCFSLGFRSPRARYRRGARQPYFADSRSKRLFSGTLKSHVPHFELPKVQKLYQSPLDQNPLSGFLFFESTATHGVAKGSE